MYYGLPGFAQSFQVLLKNNEKLFIVLLSLIALVRIFVFCAAFPFFNNVDEHAHFDTVVKYARGYTPCNNCNYFDFETGLLIARYGTLESFYEQSGPNSTPASKTNEDVINVASVWTTRINFEASSPPLYYMIAGSWYNLGKLLHFKGGYLLYWLRFINLPVYALLLAVSYNFCKFIRPESLFLRLGIILLLAFFPQDAFYSITNDVLSPLVFTCGLFLFLQLYRAGHSFLVFFLAGLMVAATILVKLSNLPALLVYCIIFVGIIIKLSEGKLLIKRLPHILLFIATALSPIVFWAGRNYYNLGDFLGTSEKIQYLGWTPKPLNELFNHPILTPDGLFYFLSELVKRFWRGEFVWLMENIKPASSDFIYVATSGLFALAGTTCFVMNAKDAAIERRLVNYSNIFIPIVFVVFLALLSMSYDFGTCFYPSRDLPFFTSGRLMLGALIPFLILYLSGVEYLCLKINDKINPLIILLPMFVFIAYMELSEVYFHGVFDSPYNFFHLL